MTLLLVQSPSRPSSALDVLADARLTRRTVTLVQHVDRDDDRLVEPSYVFRKLDAIAEGRATPPPAPARLSLDAAPVAPLLPDLVPLPRHASPARPSLRARLRHALSWKF